MHKALAAWMWLTLFRLAITLIVGWIILRRLMGHYLALTRLFTLSPWR
jgi:hypothetical protein